MIANVTVLPEYRRRGNARKLVETTLAALVERKAVIALLEVVDGNYPALIQAAEETGCVKRYSTHRMRLIFPEN